MHSDNVDVDLDLAAGTSQTITFGSTLDTGDVVTIAGFAGGNGVAADTLDLSALGIGSTADLTFTDSDADNDNTDDTLTITSADFDGSIVLVATVTADIIASNFDFA